MNAIASLLRQWRGADGESDGALVERARSGDDAAVRALVRRYNQRLFRVARGIVRDDAEAEDVVQETYVRAFTRLDGFRGEAAFATWLTRIALNEANGRLRRRRPTVELSALEAERGRAQGEVIMFPTTPAPDPESEAGREQVRRVIERAVDALPEPFRMVFILRDVQGLDIEETAALLEVNPATVKTRLFRARRLMRSEIARALSARFSDVFPFDGERCAGMAERVVACLFR